jgi:hypothetical protein
MTTERREPREPGNGGNGDKYYRPIRWLVLCSRRFGLHHQQAPHWIIALFTLILAIFVSLAWIESQKTTTALQGQLDILKAQERPFIFDAGNLQGSPAFQAPSGQVAWNYTYMNFGSTVAYQLAISSRIKVGDEAFEASSAPKVEAGHIDLPPKVLQYGTPVSRSGLNQDYVNAVLKQDGGAQIIVEFHYFDASLKESYTSSYCLFHLATGAIGLRSLTDCEK